MLTVSNIKHQQMGFNDARKSETIHSNKYSEET